jgi:transposase-like protein
MNYLATFSIITAVQMFLGGLWNYYVSSRERLKIREVQAAEALADAVQYVQLSCAYCKTGNLAKILIGEDNTFDCEACKETNSVLVETSCARTTSPIMPKLEAKEIFESIDNKE